jgi:type IV secretory pathway VirB4 component
VYKVEAQVDTKQLLQAIEQMPQPDFETFVTQVLKLRAQRQVQSLSLSESELILKIKQSIPDDLQQEFNELIEKRRSMTLTDAEHKKLIQLTDQIEYLDAKRIEYLAQLAQLKQQSLAEVMQDLNIYPPACV